MVLQVLEQRVIWRPCIDGELILVLAYWCHMWQPANLITIAGQSQDANAQHANAGFFFCKVGDHWICTWTAEECKKLPDCGKLQKLHNLFSVRFWDICSQKPKIAVATVQCGLCGALRVFLVLFIAHKRKTQMLIAYMIERRPMFVLFLKVFPYARQKWISCNHPILCLCKCKNLQVKSTCYMLIGLGIEFQNLCIHAHAS